jgi:hypothetical protein
MPTQDAEGRQDLREEGQRRLRALRTRLARRAAPISVGGKRPSPDHGQNQHDFFEHRVESAIGDQDGRDRIAETGFRQVLHRLRRQGGALVWQQQHDSGQRQGDKNAENSDKETRRAAQGFLMARALRCAQPRGGADEQNAGHAAADRRLRQQGRKQRKPKSDILDPMRACGRSNQEERTNAPGADELRRHQAIGVAGAAQDAHEPDSHGEEDDTRGREKELSHRPTLA